ncbi:MAG: SAM-dependent chlorinase/fluorinase [Deinococcales bacterium]
MFTQPQYYPQDIQEAMFNLRISYAYFPNATIFCCVVDPGVGSSRRAIAAEIAEADKLYYFVGQIMDLSQFV